MKVGQTGAVKGNCPPPEHLILQQSNQRSPDFPSAVSGGYINADLPHGGGIGGTACHSRNFSVYDCADCQHIRSLRAEFIADGVGEPVVTVELHDFCLFVPLNLKISRLQIAEFRLRQEHMAGLTDPETVFHKLVLNF